MEPWKMEMKSEDLVISWNEQMDTYDWGISLHLSAFYSNSGKSGVEVMMDEYGRISALEDPSDKTVLDAWPTYHG